MITIFKVIGTDYEIECRPDNNDIVIWKGEVVRHIVFGDLVWERLEKAKKWLRENVLGYSDDLVVRVR